MSTTLSPAQERIITQWLDPTTPHTHIHAAGRRSGLSTIAVHAIVQAAHNYLHDQTDRQPNRAFTLYVPTPATAKVYTNLVDARLQAILAAFPLAFRPHTANQIRYDDKIATIRVQAATPNTVRGFANDAAVLVDFAYYKDPTNFYTAFRPSVVATTGRTLILSNPRPEDPNNYFHFLFHGHKDTALVQEHQALNPLETSPQEPFQVPNPY